MSEIDYAELIKSPLDDEEITPGAPWSVAVPGAALGLLVGWLLTLGGGGADEPSDTTVPPPTSSAPAVVEATDYPPGYEELAPGLAATASELVVTEDSVVLGFTTATRRNLDPADVAWPIGGTWLLESAGGNTLESTRVVNGRFSPAAFSVHFPAEEPNGDASFTEARLLERWDVTEITGSIELPYGEEPFAIDAPLSVSIDQSVTLIIPRLELGRFLGAVEWQTVGAEMGTTVQVAVRLLDADGAVVGSYERFPEVRDPGDGGVLEVRWSEPFPTDQEGAVAVSLEYTVGVVESVPISLTFDLTDVPVGR